MTAQKIVTKGFADTRKHFKPPPSPEGFEWPSMPTAEQKKAFTAALHREMQARGMEESIDLARALTGTVINVDGYRTARDSGTAREWCSGAKFPRLKSASILAAYFKIPLAKLLAAPNGNGHAHTDTEVHNAAAAASMVAPKGKGGPRPLPPRLELPKDATAPAVKMETHPSDPRFVNVTFSGTLQLDVALSLMALVHPREH